ncbi:MAG: hypothetical protein M3310_06505 [Actinomycetota bacterium]|nr:hypothetical protein [Actinomycetota bacterium]
MNASSTRGSLGAEPEPPPGNELTAVLWIVVALLAVLEIAWLLFDRMYTA